MKNFKYIIMSFIISLFMTNNSYALTMANHVVENLKKIIVQCCNDAIALKGEFKNNAYYVNLKDGIVRGHSFNNVIIKFQDLTESKRNSLLNNGITFSELQENLSIKLAGDISPNEFQDIIDTEIGRSSMARRVFNTAEFSFDNDTVTVNGTMNMKRVPGNPFALLSKDEFSPFSARLSASISGTCIYLKIIDGQVNGQEMTPELIQVFHNWLNPLWDFSKLGFNCEVKDYKITPSGLRILATVF